MNKKNRDINIDAIKGIAICLVVIGHIIQFVYLPDDYSDNVLYRYIYAFHMPLFMFVSGYLVFMSGKRINLQWLKRKFCHLVVPFVCWIPLNYFLKVQYNKFSFGEFVIVSFRDLYKALWFLWILFLCCCLLWAGLSLGEFIYNKMNSTKNCKIYRYIQPFIFLLEVVLVMGISRKFTLFGVTTLSWHYIFYLGGYCVCRYKDKLHKYHMDKLKWLAIPVFAVFSYFFRIGKDPSFAATFDTWLRKNDLPHIMFSAVNWIYRYATPLAGCSCVFWGTFYLNRKIKNIFAYLGKYTMEIYILHGFFLKSYTGNCFFDSIISCIIAVVMSISISILFEKSKYLGLLLFGKYSKHELKGN